MYKKISLRNWATVCVLLVVALLLYRDPFLILWWHEQPVQRSETEALPLDMATDSIDDMYDGCRSEAAAMIDQLGVFEWHVNKMFSIAWALVEKKAKKPAHKDLGEDHATVIYMHTDVKIKGIQQEFSKAVKTGKHEYRPYRFKYHYYYFYLTDAVQVLRRNQTSCRTTYHRTGRHFNQNVVHKEMRFGAFTLTASSKDSFGFFGDVSCFEIYTCFGAEVTYYSAIDQEGQVLIPPYEAFRITDVLTDNQWCDVVYKLQSTKIPRSDLNCKLHQKKESKLKTYFGDVSGGWPIFSYAITSACIILLLVSSFVLIKRKQNCFVAAVLGGLLLLIVTVGMWKIWQWIYQG
uniref:T-cell ecto-ADP-ribosyltransferase 2-like n=1 Tax=Centroberyx gerrardi TaxID=166262 RepID=UPI003AAE54E5